MLDIDNTPLGKEATASAEEAWEFVLTQPEYKEIYNILAEVKSQVEVAVLMRQMKIVYFAVYTTGYQAAVLDNIMKNVKEGHA